MITRVIWFVGCFLPWTNGTRTTPPLSACVASDQRSSAAATPAVDVVSVSLKSDGSAAPFHATATGNQLVGFLFGLRSTLAREDAFRWLDIRISCG